MNLTSRLSRLQKQISFYISLLIFSTHTQGEISTSQIHFEKTEEITETPLSPFATRATHLPFTQIKMKESSPKMDETLNKIPGVHSRSDGSQTVSIRGSLSSSRTLILYNGTPLNMSDGLGPSTLLIPTENIDHLWLYKGPLSVYYGAHAMGGALNFKTKINKQNEALLTTSSFDTKKILLKFPWTTQQITFFGSDSQGNYSYSLKNDSQKKIIKNRENNQNKLIRSTYSGGIERKNYQLTYDLILAKENKNFPGPINNPFLINSNNEASLASLSGRTALTQSLEFKAQINHKQNQIKTMDQNQDTYHSKSTQWHQSMILTHQLPMDLNVDYFLDLNQDQFLKPHQSSLSIERVEPGVLLDLPILPNFNLQSGIRNIEKNRWISTVGVFSDFWWLHLSEGFRPPSLTDLWEETSFYIGNPDLKSELSKTLEMGFCLNCNKTPTMGNIKISLFYNHFDQLITTVYKNGRFTKLNQESAYSFGSELESSLFFGKWTALLNLGLFQGKDQTGAPLILLPHYQISAGLERAFPIFKLSLQNTLWSSFYDYDYTSLNKLHPMPGWSTLDLIFYDKYLSGWSWEFKITNLFDVHRELTLGYPEPGRTLSASLGRYF